MFVCVFCCVGGSEKVTKEENEEGRGMTTIFFKVRKIPSF